VPTDEEIQAIVDQAEPGVADALAVYEVAEVQYFAAANATATRQPIVYSTSTTTQHSNG
jgi:hypothetical protein